MKNKIIKIGFCAGEVSGDLHGAYLFYRLKKIFPDYTITGFGLGGPMMEKAGIEILHDLTHRSSVGLIESLPFVFDRYKIGKKLLKEIEKRKPDIFIFIDNQGFNIPLSFAIKKLNIKTIYYFPPPISIWGKWNGKKLQKSIDYFFIPFKDDFIEYKKYNKKKAIFYGHPFFDHEYLETRYREIPENSDTETILKILKFRNIKININKHKFPDLTLNDNKNFLSKQLFIKHINNLPYIYLMPGSRIQEIKTLLNVFIKVSDYIYKKYNIISIIPVSNFKFKKFIYKDIKTKPHIFLLHKNYYWIYKNSIFSLMASGTATLEGLILNIPMIICYQISPLTFFIGKLFVNTKWVGMANIISKTEIAKEFLQKQMSYTSIINEVTKLIEDKKYYMNIKNKMKQIVINLQNNYNSNSITLYAKKIMELI